MMLLFPAKFPYEYLDYGINWAERLGPDDTIVTATVAVDEGSVEIASQSYTSTEVTVWLEGGSPDSTSILTCQMTSAAGREFEVCLQIVILEVPA